MKKTIVLAMLLCSVMAIAQGTAVVGVAQYKSSTGGLKPINNATIQLCQNIGTLSCGTPVSLFSDVALSNSLGSSFTSDASGNYNFFVAPGEYVLSVSATGFSTFLQYLSVAINNQGNKTLSNNLILNGLLTSYGGIATVGNGLSLPITKIELAAQGANIGSTALYIVPSSVPSNTFRVNAYEVISRAATTSSTLPTVNIIYTDADTSVVNTLSLNTGGSLIGTTNILGSYVVPPEFMLSVKPGTTINYATTGYASSGGTSMQYSLKIVLEQM